jgi:hypothetical protein
LLPARDAKFDAITASGQLFLCPEQLRRGGFVHHLCIVSVALLCIVTKKRNALRGTMRTLIAVALSTTLIASTALAAGPLAPGKPAGVKQAQMNNTAWVLIGTGVVAAIAIGVASSSNGSPTSGPQNLAVTTATV